MQTKKAPHVRIHRNGKSVDIVLGVTPLHNDKELYSLAETIKRMIAKGKLSGSGSYARSTGTTAYSWEIIPDAMPAA